MQIATFWGRSWTLFHHAPASPLAVRAVTVPVIESAMLALLVAEPTVAKRTATCLTAASRGAVPVAAVTPRAEKEHLPAAQRRTDNEAKRLHVPERGTGENLPGRTCS